MEQNHKPPVINHISNPLKLLPYTFWSPGPIHFGTLAPYILEPWPYIFLEPRAPYILEPGPYTFWIWPIHFGTWPLHFGTLALYIFRTWPHTFWNLAHTFWNPGPYILEPGPCTCAAHLCECNDVVVHARGEDGGGVAALVLVPVDQLLVQAV